MCHRHTRTNTETPHKKFIRESPRKSTTKKLPGGNMLKRLTKIVVLTVVFISLPAAGHSQLWNKLTKKEKPTFFEIKEAVNKFYGQMKEGRKPGYKQFKRWEWFAGTRLDKDGYFDPIYNWKGWQEKQERFGAAHTGSHWTPRGPSTMPGILGLGRLNCIEFDPHNTDIVWVGAPTGGLWKSPDAGQTWETLTDDLPNLGVSDILIHPANSNIMYIATGDKQRASTPSIGVMKSLDGGQTWQLTGLNPVVTEKTKIGKMLMHPNDPETILAATNKGVFKTKDGGDTWINKAPGDFFDIEVNPANPSIWYASRAASGVYRSLDSGETWIRLTDGLPGPSSSIGRIAIALCSSSPNVIYAVYCKDIENIGWEWGLYGIYRTTDGGNTWTLQANSPNVLGWELDGSDTGGQGGYALILDVKPSDPDVLYVGSVEIWKSTNGGVTWRVISDTTTGAIHVDHHDFAFLPGSSTTIFSCNDGGIYRSYNEGATWTDLSSGLTIHQVYRISLSSQDPDMLLLGAQDNGSSLLHGNWYYMTGGDGTGCQIDPNNNLVLYTASQFGYLHRSSDRGASFVRIFTQLYGQPNAAWILPYTLDKFDPNTIYAASSRVYKSIDRGSSGVPISGFLSGLPITVLELAPSDPDCIIVSDGSRLFKTLNGGESWSELDTSLFPTSITDVAVHPHNRDILWVSIGGFGRWNSKFTWENIPYEIDKPKIFHSTDGGNTWSDVSGLLPNIPANCITIDPRSLNVYLGTDLGVFYSADGLGDWQRFDNGLPNVIITEMEIHEGAGKLVAAAYGRGVWESPLAARQYYPTVYPPAYFMGRLESNRSLLQHENIILLTWNPNSYNAAAGVNITRYRLYRLHEGSLNLVTEIDAADIDLNGSYEYAERVNDSQPQRYALSAVDADGNESGKLYLTVRQSN